MFGRDYIHIEEQLTLDDTDGRPFDQKMYAVSLLAKLLDRAKLLEIAFRNAREDLNEADIQSVAWIFAEDCDEVRMRAYRAGLLDDPHDAHLAWSWVESDNVGMGVLCKPPRLPIADEIAGANRAPWKEKYGGEANAADQPVSLTGWKPERTKQRAGKPRPECADPHGERGA